MEKVVLYSLSKCPWCKKARRFLDQQRVEYEYTEYDLADDPTQERIDREMNRLGTGGFPVVKIGRDVVVGYKPELYRELLDLQRARGNRGNRP